MFLYHLRDLMKYKMIIREGRKEDIPQVLKLIRELAEYENALDQVENNVESLEKDGFGKEPLFKIFVADYNRKIIGMGLIYYRYSTWKGKRLYLEDLIVKNKYRRKGVGSKLFNEIMKYGKKKSCSGLMFQVLNWNKLGINFYKKYNVQFDNEWLNCYVDF